MYLWTVQSKKVIQILLNDKIYFLDFTKSKGYEDMKNIYPDLLSDWHTVYNDNYKGLIFAFYKTNSGDYFNTINDLYNYLFINQETSKMFNFWKSDYVILQFEVNDDENIFPIDINELIILNSLVTSDFRAIQIQYSLIQNGIKDLKSYATILENYMMQGIENRPFLIFTFCKCFRLIFCILRANILYFACKATMMKKFLFVIIMEKKAMQMMKLLKTNSEVNMNY